MAGVRLQHYSQLFLSSRKERFVQKWDEHRFYTFFYQLTEAVKMCSVQCTKLIVYK